MAAVFDFLSDDDSRRRAAAVASLTLDGSPMSARVGQAIKDITYERTIEAASTVTLALIDPDGDLLDSGLFSSAVDLELPAPRNAVRPTRRSLSTPRRSATGSCGSRRPRPSSASTSRTAK
jgi:hypothetical protein